MIKDKRVVFSVISAITVCVLLSIYFLNKKDLAPLFNGVGESEKKLIVEHLSTNGYLFLEEEEAILVPSEQLSHIRKTLFEEGLLRPEKTGLELFEKADYGMTDFAQKVNYQRALQVEFEKSLMSIAGVKNARVHFRLPKKGVLFSQTNESSASVVLETDFNFVPSRSTIRGMQELVSTGVETLRPEGVNIIDHTGKLLSMSNGSDSFNLDGSNQTQRERIIESATLLLEKWFDKGSFAISVNVEINNRSEKKRVESLIDKANPAVKRKKEKFEPVQGAKGSKSVPQNIDVEYLYGREVSNVEILAGQIKRISVGVVVLKKKEDVVDAETIKKVLSAGLGIDSDRGDLIEVVFQDSYKEQLSNVGQGSPVSENNEVNLNIKDTKNIFRESGSESFSAFELEPQNDGYVVNLKNLVGGFVLLTTLFLFSFVSIRIRRNKERKEFLLELEKWMGA